MDAVILETRVTPDTGLFGENVVVLPFEVVHDFLESGMRKLSGVSDIYGIGGTHADSLLMLSPNPGVSTTVRAIRTPSSSSSK